MEVSVNEAAQKHLDAAEGFLAKGEEFYRKAAESIIAAQKADPTLGLREIGERFGRSKDWVQRLVTWHTSVSDREGPTPYAIDTPDRPVRAAKQVLRDAPIEEVERIVMDLPPARVAHIANAALHREGVTREMAQDKEMSHTLSSASAHMWEHVEQNQERKRREERGGKKGMGMDFLVDVLGDLGKARRFLEESYQAAHDHEFTDDGKEVVLERLKEIIQLAEWYRAYIETGDSVGDDELRKLLG